MNTTLTIALIGIVLTVFFAYGGAEKTSLAINNAKKIKDDITNAIPQKYKTKLAVDKVNGVTS